MPKSKSPGEGWIRPTPSGKKYRGELMLGYKPDGSRNVFRCTADTKEQVRAAFRKAHHDYERGQLVTKARQKVGQFLEQWLTDTAKPRVSPRTYVGYRELLEKHAIPAMGRYSLSELSPVHLQRLYNAKLQTLSAQRVLHLHRCLHSAFEQAVRWELVRYNPCDRVDPPKVEKREQQVLLPEQAKAFYDVACADPTFGPYFIVALVTGLRSGELYALRWEDVDAVKRILLVRRAYSRVRGIGRILKGTKTEKGRPIYLIDIALTALDRQRKAQVVTRLKTGSAWQDNGLIFANRHGGPLDENDVLDAFHGLLAKAELPKMRPYDLRHSATSLYLALGMGPKDVQAILGHANIATTMNIYAQSYPSVQADMMQRMDDLLRGSE